MFHYVMGTPFESNAGAYDGLTLWEQIDDGAHFTPTKKWLTSLPILLYALQFPSSLSSLLLVPVSFPRAYVHCGWGGDGSDKQSATS